MLAPIDSPEMEDFVRLLEPINALADASPGFVWRLKTDESDTRGIRGFEEDVLFNMSVWESVEALRTYTYESRHVEVVRSRGRWFHPPDRAPVALWWVEPGAEPTQEEGMRRLEHLWTHGVTSEAFTLRQLLDPPSRQAT
jgi:hypothetical protein